MRLAGAVFEVTFVDRDGVALAIKRPLEHLRGTAEAENALQREASFLELARHPAVPRLVLVGEDDQGSFVIEERAPGVSIDTLLERRESALPLSLAARLVAATAKAIAEIHALEDELGPLSLVHGDPSPANVIVDDDGSVRFVDFGASRFRGSTAASTTGTIPYAAPELCRGEVDVSPETDVYAVGAIALRLFAGAPLSSAESEAGRLVAIAEHGLDLRLLDAVPLPLALRDALGRVVAFRREDRDSDFQRLLAALGPLALGPA